MANVYKLFISHSWTYGDAYENLCSLLDCDFSYRDYSVPKDDPVHGARNTGALYAVQDNADKIVGWYTDSIVSGIREISL